jgi:hypothetical protein
MSAPFFPPRAPRTSVDRVQWYNEHERVRARVTRKGTRAYTREKDALSRLVGTQDVLVLPRGPAVGACSLHLGAAARRRCVSAAATGRWG